MKKMQTMTNRYASGQTGGLPGTKGSALSMENGAVTAPRSVALKRGQKSSLLSGPLKPRFGSMEKTLSIGPRK